MPVYRPKNRPCRDLRAAQPRLERAHRTVGRAGRENRDVDAGGDRVSLRAREPNDESSRLSSKVCDFDGHELGSSQRAGEATEQQSAIARRGEANAARCNDSIVSTTALICSLHRAAFFFGAMP